jgi:hypothetical protein
MAKKQNEEESIISDAAELIIQTIHIAATRIAEKYERRLMDEVVSRIQSMQEAQDTVNEQTGDYINKKLKQL